MTRRRHDDNNQRTETRFPNGTKSTVTYDSSDRWATQNVTTTSGSNLLGRTWAYTSATNADTSLVSSETDESGNKFAYTYDAANRLTKAELKANNGAGATSWTATWTLDANGNRTQQVKNGTTTNYGYNAADQLCWYGTGTSSTCTAPSGATTISYDGNGNQTLGITYTPFNQQATTGGSVPYSYAGTTNTQRLAANNVAYTPSVINGQTTVHTGSAGTQKIVRDPAGKPIAWQTGGASYYFVTDRQDSVLLLTDSSQNRAAEYGYAPYGELYFSGYYKAGDNAYRYHGAFQDLGTTGLYKMGARYYNQDTGRFTQPDPSGQEFNRYNFTNSNPVTYSDPSGLSFADFLGVASDAIGYVGSFLPGGWGLGAGIAAGVLGAASDILNNKSSDEVLGGIATDVTVGLVGGGLGKAVAGAKGAQAGWGASAAFGVTTTSAQVGEDYCSENAC